MDPFDPLDAQHIVIAFAQRVERDVTEDRHPARVDSLPYAKSIIKSAVRTSVTHLTRSGQLTDELREYFETLYTSLAEYLEPELADLMTEYRQSAEALTSAAPAPHERMQTSAWRTLSETSALAANVARATTEQAGTLRAEFRSWLAPAPE